MTDHISPFLILGDNPSPTIDLTYQPTPEPVITDDGIWITWTWSCPHPGCNYTHAASRTRSWAEYDIPGPPHGNTHICDDAIIQWRQST